MRKKCFYCGNEGDDGSIHDHHLYLRAHSDITVPLCWRCHNRAHSAKGYQFFKLLQKIYERQQQTNYYERLRSST